MISKKKFNSSLIAWYSKNKRNFPWRYNDNTYEVLVSELLLQKTDAPKVEAIYDNFFSKYPTIYDIKDAKTADIQKLLQPLGLYKKRTKRLKSIADSIANDFSGEVPKNKEDLMGLSGVGDYIANAVLCFGYSRPEPIVDTNVIRIFKRLFNIQSSKKRPRTDKEIWNFAESLIPKKNVQDYNYSLLDFASKVCKAKKPDCMICMFLKNCNFGTNYINTK